MSCIWTADRIAGTLLKLSSSAVILQTVTVDTGAQYPVFDGANIWVPSSAVSKPGSFLEVPGRV